jgi:hypothetical protein
MWVEYNPNPCHKRVGDCTVRAISALLDQEWTQTFIELCIYAYMHCDMPSSNAVWGAYLKAKGCTRDIAPDDYTVADFAADHPNGKYLLALNQHVVTVIDGNYYDAWDSGNEEIIYFWKRKED